MKPAKRCTDCNIPLTAYSTGTVQYRARTKCKKCDIRSYRIEAVDFPLKLEVILEPKHDWPSVKAQIVKKLFDITKNKSSVARILKIDVRCVRRYLNEISDSRL